MNWYVPKGSFKPLNYRSVPREGQKTIFRRSGKVRLYL